MPSCLDCGKGFGDGGCGAIHAGRWEGACAENFVYDCKSCMDVFNTKNRRRSHMNREHTAAKCDKCEKPFYDKGRLLQHSKSTEHALKDADKIVKDINKAARRMHDEHARPPPGKHNQGFQDYVQVTNNLAKNLKDMKLTTRQDYLGGAYERTSIRTSDYDVQFINRDTAVKVQIPDGTPPGYAKLMKESDPIYPKVYMDKMKGIIQKLINKDDFGDKIVMMAEHGPAITLSVSRDGSDKRKTYIDAVPAIETKDGHIYVPKPPKDMPPPAGEQPDLWRRSYAAEAKEKLLTADRGNGCRKEAYRLMKYVRNEEPNLRHIPSYHLKSALFNVMDTKPDAADWSRDKLGDRTKDLVKHTAAVYRSGQLLDYFEPQINLLGKVDPAARENTANRLDYLAEHPESMFRMNKN